MDVNTLQQNLTPMNHTFRSMLLTGAALFGLAAFAQPTPPYPILITGMVQGCMPNSQVTITSMPGTLPTWSYTLDLVNCSFDTLAWMQSPGGGFTITVPCNGAMLTGAGQYQVGPSGADSIMVLLNCSGGGSPDCLGVPGGNALPGTSCTTLLGEEGTWNTNCQCEPNVQSCQACFTVMSNSPWTAGFMNCSTGNAPFTYQWWLPNGGASSSQNADWTFTSEGFYGICLTIADASGCTSTQCDTVYVDANGGVSTGVNYIDCLGIPNGSALIGTSCTTLNGEEGTWNTNCQCEPNASSCQAGFWVIQAYEGDSLNGEVTPIPNEVWVWNLSSGTSPFQFLWNFGDGTTSTDPYPTHVYPQSGPYELCLTLTDAVGCTSTYCDQVSIDENGIYNGMVIDGRPGSLRSGFTIRVREQVSTGMQEAEALNELRTWPNPVSDHLNLSFRSTLRGTVQLQLVDVNGRVHRTANATFTTGDNRIQLSTAELPAGLYLLRMEQAGHAQSIRFVKD
jgi:PKD repeat protein